MDPLWPLLAPCVKADTHRRGQLQSWVAYNRILSYGFASDQTLQNPILRDPGLQFDHMKTAVIVYKSNFFAAC